MNHVRRVFFRTTWPETALFAAALLLAHGVYTPYALTRARFMPEFMGLIDSKQLQQTA